MENQLVIFVPSAIFLAACAGYALAKMQSPRNKCENWLGDNWCPNMALEMYDRPPLLSAYQHEIKSNLEYCPGRFLSENGDIWANTELYANHDYYKIFLHIFEREHDGRLCCFTRFGEAYPTGFSNNVRKSPGNLVKQIEITKSRYWWVDAYPIETRSWHPRPSRNLYTWDGLWRPDPSCHKHGFEVSVRS